MTLFPTEEVERVARGRDWGAEIIRQQVGWQNALKFGAGNPYATLCQHCFGRHEPPRDDLCIREAPGGGASRHGLAVSKFLQENPHE